MLSEYTPYTTTLGFTGPAPSWLPSVQDQQRINAYNFYEQAYWSVNEVYKLSQRGQDANPIYLPTARTIIDTCHRYLAVGLAPTVDPAVGTPQDQALVRAALKQLYARERMKAKLTTQKRYGLIRGDAIWHVVANPLKPQGSRISIYDIDPASYFPIEDPDVPGRVVGCHLVNVYEDLAAKKTYIRRRTYRKDDTTNTVTSELILFELSGWDDRSPGAKLKQVKVIEPAFTLPPTINSLPVYHVRNTTTPEDMFGSSELRGYERILAGLSQGISDEELTLVMQGLGVYATNSGPPVDENGKEMNWRIGPGEVLELDAGGVGEKVFFDRVNGVQSVTPMLDHLNFLLTQVYEASATADVARGSVDVQLAESGIALALKLSPLLAKNSEKEDEMLPVLDNMHYDLIHKWYPAYESSWAPDILVQVEMTVKDPMPQNRDAKVKEIVSLATSVPPIISAAHARLELSALGYEFPPEVGADIVQEQAALSEAQMSDPFASRVAEELAAEAAAGGATA